MSIWGKLGGAAAGLAMGGPLGAVFGAFAGHILDRFKGANTPEKRKMAFTIGVIALSAKMAKADGVVTADEVTAFRDVFHVPENELQNVSRFFDLARKDMRGYEMYAEQLAKLFADDPAILEEVLNGLFHIAKADGMLHDKEQSFLQSVAQIFGMSEGDYMRVKAAHFTDAADPYVILGADRSMSDAEVKSLYRKLVVEHHPDRLIASGMPEEFVAVANEKLAGVNAAWDQIQKERGIT